MGREKASLPWGTTTLAESVAATMSPLVDEVVLVVRENQELRVGGDGLRVARDVAEGLGPLAGLVAGLEATDAEAGFLISCDQPFVDAEVVRRLLAAADRQITVPRVGGHLLMTTGVYRRSVLADARALVARRRLRPVFLLETCSSRVLDDLDPAKLRDLDTPEDYALAAAERGYTAGPA